jgi:2,5-diketo-D-gluconate reductase A
MTSNLTLNNGVEMPALGFGVFQTPPQETIDAVEAALGTGYRHIDTAAAYGNEREVGEAIRRSGLARSDVFVETKIWIDDYGYDAALHAFDKSAGKLGVDQIDLLILHQALPSRFDLTIDACRALEKLLEDGRVRAIGVSNFMPGHLDDLLKNTGVVPAVNQIEVHPYFANEAARAATLAHGAKVESWSPLGQGGGELTDPVVAEIAAAHGKSPAQVLLRWQIDRGDIVFPKSVRRERLEENLAIFDFELSADQVTALAALDKGESGRCGPNPDTFGWIPSY